MSSIETQPTQLLTEKVLSNVMIDTKQVGQNKKRQCPHDKRKDKCIICSSHMFCIHKKAKETCVECGGSRVCPHGKRKNICKECKGAYLCECGKQKHTCPIHKNK
jgi:hypothetical protein